MLQNSVLVQQHVMNDEPSIVTALLRLLAGSTIEMQPLAAVMARFRVG